MLAIIYLALTFWIGDLICRRFCRFTSAPHRAAGAFLVGLLTSTWFTYLSARIFAGTTLPLIWGNLLFLLAAILIIGWTRRKRIGPSPPIEELAVASGNGPVPSDMSGISVAESEKTAMSAHSVVATDGPERDAWIARTETESSQPRSAYQSRPPGSDRLDWLFVGVYLLIACWLMFATLDTTGSNLRIGHNQFSDFGSNTAIVQSFAVGHNFPTEYPHFAGDRIRYHFLFYFQAGNLEFLGLDPAWALNALSILSLVAMLILLMVLGELLFNSRAIGRIGSALFFFFGSLSYIPYLRKYGSPGSAIHAI